MTVDQIEAEVIMKFVRHLLSTIVLQVAMISVALALYP